MSLRLGSRLFSPRPFTTAVTLVLLALLLSLGRWQLHRAHDKQVLFDAFAAGSGTTRALDADAGPLPRYQHIEARGRYDASRQVLIDNMVDHERPGYEVITPFALDSGGWILVNRGWVAPGRTRRDLPPVPATAAAMILRGRLAPLPVPGIRLKGAAPLAAPFPILATFPTAAEIHAAVGEARWAAAGESVLLDAAEPDGFARNWTPGEFPPMRHIGYAVQWFGLALALAVIYVVTNTRKAAARA